MQRNIDEATTRVTDAARRGLKLVKQRAQRRDPVGEATHRALELVSDGLGATAKALRQLGAAVEPAPRGSHNTPAAQSAPRPRPRRRPTKRTTTT
ncbi:MAG TPA: hypothetical protein VOB72_00480 [Candidatus Dormibacteraeota bacterium]|nr:hypothetical protein [Candidatus Dormibacteraeota bacterium]